MTLNRAVCKSAQQQFRFRVHNRILFPLLFSINKSTIFHWRQRVTNQEQLRIVIGPVKKNRSYSYQTGMVIMISRGRRKMCGSRFYELSFLRHISSFVLSLVAHVWLGDQIFWISWNRMDIAEIFVRLHAEFIFIIILNAIFKTKSLVNTRK